jgi:hypothetical protein
MLARIATHSRQPPDGWVLVWPSAGFAFHYCNGTYTCLSWPIVTNCYPTSYNMVASLDGLMSFLIGNVEQVMSGWWIVIIGNVWL